MNNKAFEIIKNKNLGELSSLYPATDHILLGLRLAQIDKRMTLMEALDGIHERYLEDFGMNRETVIQYFIDLIDTASTAEGSQDMSIDTITIIGGHDKDGNPENAKLVLKRGQITCVVGMTGSGKSRLLADIECLAQKDTPTGRQILLNGKVPTMDMRFSLESRLVAQLSQNMNFIMDLSVCEFVHIHAESRTHDTDTDKLVGEVIDCANNLSGEQFSPDASLTQLSGGQSRALMIADNAIISASPIILIDEIENAGIDRKKALDLLIKHDKLTIMSTHDPLLALSGNQRIIIENGGISKIIEANQTETGSAKVLSKIDAHLEEIRNHIRNGEEINIHIEDFVR